MRRINFKKVVLVLMLTVFGTKAFADGLVVVRPIRPQPRPVSPYALGVKYHYVDVKINDLVAVTEIDQVFVNPTRYRLEGTYIFPLPVGASIKNFSMDINGKMVSAELLDAKKARKIYTDIVRSMKDPALLEYQGRGLLKARIFPIEPGSEKRVKIKYTQLLKQDNGLREYVYPLNTEKFSSIPVKDVRVTVDVNSSKTISTLYSPSHSLQIERKGKRRVTAEYRVKNAKPDRDLVLYYMPEKDDVTMSVLAYKEKRSGYFLLQAAPSVFGKKIIPKDIVFVMDTSGSMSGKKMKQAKKALRFCLDNLNKKDRFQVVSFGTEAESLFSSVKSVSKSSIKKAETFVDEMRPIGGTNIEEALTLSQESFKGGSNPRYVLFITDGKPTIGETNYKNLLKHLGKGAKRSIRIFSIGIGNEVNTKLLQGFAQKSGAEEIYISEKEDIEIKISSFYTKLSSPVLTDVKLRVRGNVRIKKYHPRKLPDLFKGSTLVVLGQFTGSGKEEVVISGTIGGKRTQYRRTVNFSSRDSHSFIPGLWAQRRVAYLLEEIGKNGESKELKDEVTTLAKAYGIVTPYTSYLILEDERIRARRAPIAREERFQGNIIEDKAGSAKAYESMKKDTGRSAVSASRDIKRMKYKAVFDRPSKRIIRYAAGRAFYFTGRMWIDSRLDQKKRLRKRRVKFGSKEYFRIVTENKRVGEVLSLGKEIRFVHRNRIVEIVE